MYLESKSDFKTGNSLLYYCPSSWPTSQDDFSWSKQNHTTTRMRKSTFRDTTGWQNNRASRDDQRNGKKSICRSWVPSFANMTHPYDTNKIKWIRSKFMLYFKQQQHHTQSSGTCLNASCSPAVLDFCIFRIAFCMSSCLIGRM